MRTPPAAFVQRLRSTFGADWDVRWNDTVGRWEFISLSAGGKPVSQFWGWFYDATTHQPLDPDPVTGLHPFRDLDPTSQEEIVQNLHRSYIGRTGHGALDWEYYMAERRAHNTALAQSRRRARAQAFADLLKEVDLRRPFVKHHAGSDRSRRVAYGGTA